MVKYRACYQENTVLTQLMTGLRSQEWRTRVLQQEGETTLELTVPFIEKCESGLMHSLNMERAGTGAMSAVGTRPKMKQPTRTGKYLGSGSVLRNCAWVVAQKSMGMGQGRPGKNPCPASGKPCNRCKNQGHFFNV